MDTGLDKAKLQRYKAAALKHLGEPAKLRLAVALTVALLAGGAAYVPLSGQIEQARAQVTAEKRRLDAIAEVDGLMRQVETYRPRIGQDSDTNEWVQYLLAGLRKAEVKLHDMESKEPQRVGPFEAVTLALEAEGPYPKLKEFIEWLEQSDRLLRIDSMRFEKRPTGLAVKIVVLGLVVKKEPGAATQPGGETGPDHAKPGRKPSAPGRKPVRAAASAPAGAGHPVSRPAAASAPAPPAETPLDAPPLEEDG